MTESNGSTSSPVLYEVNDHIALLTLNRPEKLNAINTEMRAELDRRLDEIAADPDVRVVVLTGAGRAFCAGADLSGGGGGLGDGAMDALESFDAISRRQLKTLQLPQPVIAAVNGYCLGRGLELALWCDVVIAASGARLGEPEIRDGAFVSSIIPWLTTPQRAKLVMWTGDHLTAAEAYELGLVTMVADDALAAALALANRLLHVPAPAARAVKRYVNMVTELQGLTQVQGHGNALGALLRGLSPAELGTEHLVRIRETDGLKAYLTARDAPFAKEVTADS